MPKPKQAAEPPDDCIPTPDEIRAAPPNVAQAIRQVLDAFCGGETRFVVHSDDWSDDTRAEVARRFGARGWAVRFDDGMHGSEVILSDARAELAEAERADALSELARVTRERDALRAIVAGRTTPPTDEEIAAHEATGGLWRWVATIDGDVARGLSGDACEAPRGGAFVGMPRRFASVYAETWWPLDAHGLPCAWPVVGEVQR